MDAWQISKELEQLEDLIDQQLSQTDGELTGTVEGLLKLQADIVEQVELEEVAKLLRKNIAFAEAYSGQAAAFRAEATRCTRIADRLKALALVVLDAKGIKSEGGLTKRANGGAAPLTVLAESPDDVPERFTKTKIEIDNTAIRSALDAGEELEFASLGERGHHIRVAADPSKVKQ